MKQLSDDTNVSVKRITQYIRDGRLEISHGMAGEIICTQCGRPILTGRFCEQCAMDIKMTALEKKREAEVKRVGTMHVKR
jgi:hypothetical protein